MQLGTPILTRKCSIMSPVKRKSIYFGVKRSRSRVTNQCRRGSVHSCECWLILVRHWHDVARSFFDGMNVIKLFAALFTESLSVWESVVSRRLSRVCPLGEIHLRQTRTAAVDPGIVVGRPQSCEPFVAQTTARVEPVQRSQPDKRMPMTRAQRVYVTSSRPQSPHSRSRRPFSTNHSTNAGRC